MDTIATITACTSHLLGRAIAACCAESSKDPQIHIEIMQSLQSSPALTVKVVDNGSGLPSQKPALHKLFDSLQKCIFGSAIKIDYVQLQIRTSGKDESRLRLYSIVIHQGQLGVIEAGEEAKPNASAISGTECELIVNQDHLVKQVAHKGAEVAIPARQLLTSIEQMLRLTKILAPAVQFGLGVNNVLLEDSIGQLVPTCEVTWFPTLMHQCLSDAQIFLKGMATEFCLSQSTKEHRRKNIMKTPGISHYFGIGEAGCGCDGGAVQYRGCRLQMESAPNIVKAFERCHWDTFGFKLQPGKVLHNQHNAANGSSNARFHTFTMKFNYLQPQLTARISAIVVHLQPSGLDRQAVQHLPKLSATSEGRMVRAAVDNGMHDLQRQLQTILADKRQRSLMRAVPCIVKSLTGMLARNSESEIMQTAVALLGCDVDDALKFLDISITSAINCRMNSSDCSKTTCKKQRT